MRAKVVFYPSCVLACARTQAYALVHVNVHMLVCIHDQEKVCQMSNSVFQNIFIF